MVEVFDITIPELTGKKKRRAYIYLPESYEQNPDWRYPVLYMFDGHNVFFDEDATYGKSWGMKDYMDYSETQCIIAAVECNDDAHNGRLKEYCPYNFRSPEFGYIRGKGTIYMEWLVNTFKPMVDENYRTIPDREATMIAGSSMGGLMSLYAVLHYNHIFHAAACLSPSVWFNKTAMFQMVNSAEVDPDTIIYMDYGSGEFANHEGMKERYIKVTSILMEKGIYLESRIVPKGEHCEASWERQVPFFMDAILYDPDEPYYEEDETEEQTEIASEGEEEYLQEEENI